MQGLIRILSGKYFNYIKLNNVSFFDVFVKIVNNTLIVYSDYERISVFPIKYINRIDVKYYD